MKLIGKGVLVFLVLFVASDFFIYFVADGMYRDFMTLGCDSPTSVFLTVILIVICGAATVGLLQASKE